MDPAAPEPPPRSTPTVALAAFLFLSFTGSAVHSMRVFGANVWNVSSVVLAALMFAVVLLAWVLNRRTT
jgi:hypothetical protein